MENKPGGKFPKYREKYQLLTKEIVHGSGAFSAALFWGGGNEMTHSWWQLGELCSSGAGMKRLTFGGTFWSKKVFKH